MGNLCYSISVCLAFCYLVMAGDYGSAEIDLVFPGNDTYAPITAFPVIFAIRSPENIPRELEMEIRYSISSYDSNKSLSDPEALFVSRADHMVYGQNIQVALGKEVNLKDRDGTWRLDYTIYFVNCTDKGYDYSSEYSLGNSAFDLDTSSVFNHVVFSTKKGLPRPNLSNISGNNNCSDGRAFSIQIDRLASVPPELPAYNPELPSCAIVHVPSPLPTLCNSGLPSQIVYNISSDLLTSACRSSSPPDDCSELNSSIKLATSTWAAFLALAVPLSVLLV